MLIKRTDFWLVVAALIIVISLFTTDTSDFSFAEMEANWSQKVDSFFSSDEKSPTVSSVKNSKEKDSLTNWFGNLFDTRDSKEQKNSSGDLLTDSGAVAQVVSEFKNKNGNSLVVYGGLAISPENIVFIRRNPEVPEQFDSYIWQKKSGWEKPKREKTPKVDEIKRFSVDLGTFKFEMVPDLAKRAVKELSEKGFKDGKVQYVMFSRRYFSGDNREPMIRVLVKNNRREGSVEFGKDGELLKVNVR